MANLKDFKCTNCNDNGYVYVNGRYADKITTWRAKKSGYIRTCRVCTNGHKADLMYVTFVKCLPDKKRGFFSREKFTLINMLRRIKSENTNRPQSSASRSNKHVLESD